MTTIVEAVDIMCGHAAAALGATPTTYSDVPAPLQDGDTMWARVTVKHGGSGGGAMGDGTKRYDRIGILCVEVFGPLGDGGLAAQILAQTVLNSLEDVRSSPVWYRNIRAVDVGPDGGFSKINVYADFEYSDYH
jgi:hypothetical protein